MRTRVADDYTSIRERMEELRGKPSDAPTADIGWWRAVGDNYWYTPLSKMGREAMKPYSAIPGTAYYGFGGTPPETLKIQSICLVGCVFTEIPPPPT